MYTELAWKQTKVQPPVRWSQLTRFDLRCAGVLCALRTMTKQDDQPNCRHAFKGIAFLLANEDNNRRCCGFCRRKTSHYGQPEQQPSERANKMGYRPHFFARCNEK